MGWECVSCKAIDAVHWLKQRETQESFFSAVSDLHLRLQVVRHVASLSPSITCSVVDESAVSVAGSSVISDWGGSSGSTTLASATGWLDSDVGSTVTD